MNYCPECGTGYDDGPKRCADCAVDLVELAGDEAPPGKLLTVAAFDTPTRAAILASRLEAEGIECFIADAETIGMHALLAGAVGGVKVQVREADAPRAMDIVRSACPPPSRPACPGCGSTETRRKGLSLPMAILAVLTLGVLALFFSTTWICTPCSREWK